MPVNHDLQLLASMGRALWSRKAPFAACLVAAVTIGLLYHFSHPPVFESTAEVMFQSGSNSVATRQIVDSDAILIEAVRRLPPVYRKAFNPSAPTDWVPRVREALTVKIPRTQTHVRQLAYRANNAQKAARFLDSIVNAYVAHVRSFHAERKHQILSLQTTTDALQEEVAEELKALGVLNERIKKLESRIGSEISRVISMIDQADGDAFDQHEPAETAYGSQRNNWMPKRTAARLPTETKADIAALQQRIRLRQWIVNSLNQISVSKRNKIPNVAAWKTPEPLQIEVTLRPVPASSPVSASLSSTLLLSVFFGIIVGLSAVYVLDRIDTRFRAPVEIESLTQAPVLVTIGEFTETDVDENDKEKRGPLSIRALETFQNLQVALHLSKCCRVVSITSTGTGEGKTTIAANLAAAFARNGQRTLLIDADLRQRGLSVHFLSSAEKDWVRVVGEGRPIQEQTLNHLQSEEGDIDVLTCGSEVDRPLKVLSADSFAELLHWARERYSRVVLDTPASSEFNDAAIVGSLSDSVVLVVDPRQARQNELSDVTERLRSFGCRLAGIVVNRIRNRSPWNHFRNYTRGCDGWLRALKEHELQIHNFSSDDGVNEPGDDSTALAIRKDDASLQRRQA